MTLQDKLIRRKILIIDPWYELILRMLSKVIDNFKDRKMLEIGCGLGGFCIHIARKGAEVIGLDISAVAIKKAKEIAKQYGIGKSVEFVVGDAQHLPFKDLSGEIIVCSETLEHIPNSELAFSELVRITQKSGYLCITVPNLLSTMFFEYLILSTLGQPQYAREFLSVEKEHIFHIFKIKKLLYRGLLDVLEIKSVDLLHLPPRLRETLKIGFYLDIISSKLQRSFSILSLFGATIGILARKK